jgi:tetratricopeptide (TPR) repeat protein
MGMSGTDPNAARNGLTAEKSIALLDLANARIKEEKYAEALEPVMKLYQSYPENPVYIQKVADIYDHLGRYKEEAELWEKFMQNAPPPWEGCPQIGLAYQKQGLKKQTIDAFERCLAFDTRDADALFFLGHAVETVQQYDRAGKLYEQCLGVSPHYPDCRAGYARVLIHQGRAADARKIGADVLAETPDFVDALLVVGLADWRLGNAKEAREYLERGIKLSQTYGDFYEALGRIEQSQGHFQQALVQYSRVLELDAQNDDVLARWRSLMLRSR